MMNSIHLDKFPEIDKIPDFSVVKEINSIRSICSNALSIRKEFEIKVRTPLSSIQIFGKNIEYLERYRHIIASEVNVKKVELRSDIMSIGSEKIDLNFKKLGPIFGAKVQQISRMIKSGEHVFRDEELYVGEHLIPGDCFEISFSLTENISGRFCKNEKCVVILDTKLDEKLISEGVARDLIRAIQQERKDLNLNVADRINIEISTPADDLKNSLNEHSEYIKYQCLINDIAIVRELNAGKKIEIDDMLISFVIKKNV
jgi:isoleucyl-tRNA synthetase